MIDISMCNIGPHRAIIRRKKTHGMEKIEIKINKNK